jgi:LPS sulfotransferase NodH/transposase-like protein
VESKRKNLIIASGVRSGSTFIAESIAYHFQAVAGRMLFGLTLEHFNGLDSRSTGAEMLARLNSLWADKDGWATVKIMCSALSLLMREAAQLRELHAALFGEDTFWIVVRRRNRVRGAVSLANARHTGEWHAYSDSPEDSNADVSLPDTQAALKAILLDDVFLSAFSENVPKGLLVNVYYEDFLSDPLPLIRRLHDVLGVESSGEGVLYRDQSKIRPRDSAAKDRAEREFNTWFSRHYYGVTPPAGVAAAENATEALREKVVNEFLKGRRSIRTIAHAHGIESYVIKYWVEQFRHGGSFSHVSLAEQLEMLKSRCAALERELEQYRA